jgi:isopentenyl-diphosphate delta-isomerase
VPVIAKEVGWGISGDTARQLVEAGVTVIDVAGAGGTSWSQVELHRAKSEEAKRIATTFIDWGIPTADAIIDVRTALPETPIIASGGLRNGLDAAKCIALGADLTAMASPFLKAAAQSPQALQTTIEGIIRELHITMFACGAGDSPALKQAQLLLESRR